MLIYSLLITFLLLPFNIIAEDYYELLGISRDADDRTIRKAFKKLAIQKHPDKNQDNPKAHDEFVKINKAYEILKDEELRKKYDQYGEEGLKDDFQGGNQYQSWQFYKDNFGIYDDDPEIVTLNRADFQQTVIDSGDFWFINFYSTFCSHCHDLAPTWREFAREMEGVVRIGAVNCAEDPGLCQQNNVMGYPSLVVFPDRVFYQGHRELNPLINFIMSKLVSEVHHVTFKNYKQLSTEWEKYSSRPWILDFCDDEEYCLSKSNRRKLSSMLYGIANVGVVGCPEHKRDLLCKKLRSNGVAFYPAGQIVKEQEHEIESLDPKEIYNKVLDLMPDWQELTDEMYEKLISKTEDFTLIRFIDSTKTIEDKNSERDLKKLPNMFIDVKMLKADCSKISEICTELNLKSEDLPKFVLFKPTGDYEINYNKKSSIHDIATFLRESKESNLITLTEEQYRNAVESDDELWIIDYFAPWCPPCLKLIPQLRQMRDTIMDIKVNTGTLDCVAYKHICQELGIGSYPTTLVYYKGNHYQTVGYHSSEQIADFIMDALNPSVEMLDPSNFNDLVLNRESGVTWIVDFYAPWCGPCMQLAPEFRKLARQLKNDNEKLYFGTIDCDEFRQLCISQRVQAYPTIRLFRHKLNQQTLDYPQNWWRDSESMQRWVREFLPSLVENMGQEFYQEVLEGTEPWLVDFFAPWCGHCQHFAPVFERIAKMLEGKVKLAKVDCDRHPAVCQAAQIRAYPSIRFYPGMFRSQRQLPTGMVVQSQSPDAIIQIVENELRKHREKDEL